MRKVIQFVAAVLALSLSAVLNTASPSFAQSATIGRTAHDTAAPFLAQLKTAKDEATARMLEAQVWAAWTHSGDEEIDALMLRATAMMQTLAFDEALATLDTVVTKAPRFAEGWNKRATLLYMMNDYDRSLSDILKVLELEPLHFGAISGMGLIRTAQGHTAAAVAAYRRVLEIDPMNAGAKVSIDALGNESDGAPI